MLSALPRPSPPCILQAGSMQAAAAVLNFYLIGGDPDNTDLYLGDNSCPAKLVALLQSGAKHSRNTAVISSLAKVVIHIFTESHKTRSALEPCKADVPAVLLALISTYCPERGTLYNAFTGTTSVCEFNKVSLLSMLSKHAVFCFIAVALV